MADERSVDELVGTIRPVAKYNDAASRALTELEQRVRELERRIAVAVERPEKVREALKKSRWVADEYDERLGHTHGRTALTTIEQYLDSCEARIAEYEIEIATLRASTHTVWGDLNVALERPKYGAKGHVCDYRSAVQSARDKLAALTERREE